MSRNSDDVESVKELYREFEESGTVANVVVLRVPKSEKFPEGVKVRMHYGRTTGDDEPILRYLENRRFSTTRRNGEPFRDDNSHGEFEKHVEGEVKKVEFDGYEEMLDDFEHEVKDNEGVDRLW